MNPSDYTCKHGDDQRTCDLCDMNPNEPKPCSICYQPGQTYASESGAPLTQFKHGFLQPGVWHRFTQLDEHRGTTASDFCWRGFIRATHKNIQPPKSGDWLRRHSQVYLDAESYQW